MLIGCSCIYFNMFVVSHTHTHMHTHLSMHPSIYTVIKNLKFWGQFLEVPIIFPPAFAKSINNKQFTPKILPGFPAQSLSSMSNTSAVSWSLESTTEIKDRHSMRLMGKSKKDVDNRYILWPWFLTCPFSFFC